MLQFDHVILTVADRAEAAAELYERTGLAAVEGGVHPGHGTGNFIVPLGPNYLELMGVVDTVEAEDSPVGRWVLSRIDDGLSVGALCLRTDDIAAVSAHIGDPPRAMSRTTPDGVEISWRLAGLERALVEGLPFFIQWDVADIELPGTADADHSVEPQGIAWVEWGGDPAVITHYLGDHELDIRITSGPPGPIRVGITTDTGEIVV